MVYYSHSSSGARIRRRPRELVQSHHGSHYIDTRKKASVFFELR